MKVLFIYKNGFIATLEIKEIVPIIYHRTVYFLWNDSNARYEETEVVTL